MTLASMRYRRFGKTELSMPVLSCGAMRFHQQWKDCPSGEIDPENQANLESTVRRAFELGINHFETARGYGTSEMQLGRVLPKLPRDEIIVQTKVGPKENAQDFLKEFETSMGYLQLDKINLLGLHGINTLELLDYSLRPGGCLDVAEKLRAQGRVDFIGFSTHGRNEVIVKAIESGRFDYVNLHWYYIFQDNWPAIEAATAQDMGVFIISPSEKGGMLFNPTETLKRLCVPLSPMVFNDLFCLSCPGVKTLSLGAAQPGDFDEHLKAVEQLDQAARLVEPIIRRLDTHLSERLGEHWVKTWQQGLPLPEQTPGGINIAVMLWLRNLVVAFEMVDYAKMRYNLFGEGGHWFPGARIENLNALKSLDLRDCLSQSPYAEKIPGYLAETYQWLAGKPVSRLSKSS